VNPIERSKTGAGDRVGRSTTDYREIKNNGRAKRLIHRAKLRLSNALTNLRKLLTRWSAAAALWISSSSIVRGLKELKEHQRKIFKMSSLGVFLITCAALIDPDYKLLYNPSESAPVGWYLFKRTQRVHVGEYVLAMLPQEPATLANDRGYLARSMPILKHAAAVAAEEVCRERDEILIDGILITHTLERDGKGRLMPRWTGCRRLAPSEVFLLSTENPLSFDGRYFGPVPKSSILGAALPLWTH